MHHPGARIEVTWPVVLQAAQGEASALSAVTAWYWDVQRKHAAAGLGDDPILASILPGSARKLSREDPPEGDGGAAEAQVGTGPACTPCGTSGSADAAAVHHLLHTYMPVCTLRRMACSCARCKDLTTHILSVWLRQYMVMQEDNGGPLLQALMSSLPAVPQMPKQPSSRLPGRSSVATSVWQSQVCSS